MSKFRNARRRASFMLVWFALSVFAAIASPMTSSVSFDVVCSSSGVMKVLPQAGDDGLSPAASSMLDCPLCMPIGAPPPVARAVVAPVFALFFATLSVAAAHSAFRTASPLPARGPPQIS
jgi:hypothetical protein